MANFVITYDLVNDTGNDVTDASLFIEVAGTQVGMGIQRSLLANNTKTLTTQTTVDSAASLNWVVSFKDKKGATQKGSVTCNCVKTPLSKPVVVTLKSAGAFTVDIPKSGVCEGIYEPAGAA